MTFEKNIIYLHKLTGSLYRINMSGKWEFLPLEDKDWVVRNELQGLNGLDLFLMPLPPVLSEFYND